MSICFMICLACSGICLKLADLSKCQPRHMGAWFSRFGYFVFLMYFHDFLMILIHIFGNKFSLFWDQILELLRVKNSPNVIKGRC